MKSLPAIAGLSLMGIFSAAADEPECVEIQEAVQVQLLDGGDLMHAPIQVDLGQLQADIRIQLGDGLQLQGVDGPPPQTEAIPKEYAKFQKVTMIMEDMKHHEDGLGYHVTFRIINPTKELMQFAGASEKNPRTQKQMWRNEAWEDEKRPEHPQKRIRQMIRKCRIAPGQSAVFQASFSLEELPARIGLGYSNGHHDGKHMKVWSEKIGR